MNETNSLTLDEAKAQVRQLIAQEDAKPVQDKDESFIDGLVSAMQTFSRVEQPSEEDMAVLWLIRRMGWRIYYAAGWRKSDECYTFNPAEEAKKLGWGG